MFRTKRDIKMHAWGADIVIPAGTEVVEVNSPMGPGYAVKDVALIKRLTGNTHDPEYRWTFVDPWDAEAVADEYESRHRAEQWQRQADHIDGYDRDDLGESPDF